MGKNQFTPPKLATKFISWYCKPELLEDLLGDLEEMYLRNVKAKGHRHANWIYILDAFKFLRWYTLKLKITRMVSFSIIYNYFITSLRVMKSNLTFTFINSIGLAISLSVGLLVIAYIINLQSFDKFHSHYDEIYRLQNTYIDKRDGAQELYASTSIKLFSLLEDEVTGVDKKTIIRKGRIGDFSTEKKTIPLRGHYADKGFFDVFTFPLIAGDPKTALDGINKVVLTEESAIKLFGDTQALGKEVVYNKENVLTVSGIVKDVPDNSHFYFDQLISFATIDNAMKTNTNWNKWDYMWLNFIYIIPEEGVSENDIKVQLDVISKRESADSESSDIAVSLLPLAKIIPGENYSNQLGRNVDMMTIYMLSVLALIVIVSATFNYSNLSIARSMSRLKEVGVRKTMGASRNQIFNQFIMESVLIALISLCFAIGLFFFLRPYFIGLVSNGYELTLALDASITFFIGLAFITGLLGGLLPAVYFSKYSPQGLLKTEGGVQKGRMKKFLIGVQYVFAFSFVLMVSILYHQYDFSLNYNLGYSTKNILNIPLRATTSSNFETEIRRLAQVKNTSKSLMITSIGDTYGSSLKYPPGLKSDSINVHFNAVDDEYINVHKHTLIAGANFEELPETSETQLAIINENLSTTLGITNPQKAIGEEVIIDGVSTTVVGVATDFHYKTLFSSSGPFALIYQPGAPYEYLNVELNENVDKVALLSEMDAVWKKFDQEHQFEAYFYDDQIKGAYKELDVYLKIIGYLSFIAISISIMGLLGMVIYTTESKSKEMGIRKVLGASTGQLIQSIGKSYVLLMILSYLVAGTLTYYLVSELLFSELAIRAKLTPTVWMGGALVIILISVISIIIQAYRVAAKNPAVTLKYD
ncbi:ABC transporter permease [Fulvivirga lutimaris]|uniref:ABC transporter permease n=1 Tax=Fulvivirga lutimaris TaxID=1819566 RepID=UPI0012BD3E3B|nr:ABC transporter permease [Fulvivirga lutimaris]MTI38483.1 ABC transporter permease [Fulvivirga lutimaris]